ncbi:hypothetical protein QTQ03_20530 [Micromonospora sp. WMMA1363]|uniref:hypothetical protein n=1 Tax=Micromonospora sp. WMMA1363 TaxID=3053985 RepID=UPI00259D0E64|nr:hypothetical protein [Micromonospora sp. WMMA1363]MDM4721866.1 hypothetical protein [Micromonospora sp. WMMA1363]
MDEIVDVLPIVARVARSVNFMYGISEEEAYGLLSLDVAERSRDYLILFEEGHTGLIARRLKNVAAVHSRGDRVKRMAETDQYYYDPEYVRLFLPFFFAIEDWDNGPAPDDGSGKWATGEALDTALDIKAAWDRLKAWQTTVITVRHLLRPGSRGEVDWNGVAEVIGRKTGASAQTAYAQATAELTAEMNAARDRRSRQHNGPGARTPVTNSTAQHMISVDQ